MIMIHVTFLGTSGSSPTKERRMPSLSLEYGGELFLFDCGEGTQMQMLKYGINAYRLNAIFLSHAHGDHIIGLAGLIRTLALNKRYRELKIFTPKGYESTIKRLIAFDKAIIKYDIRIIGVRAGRVFKGKGFSVYAFKLNHTIPTYGYVFKEDDKRRFIKERCTTLGIKGKMFSEIQKRGYIKIGNRRIGIRSITRLQRGKKVVYAADTRPASSTISVSKHADMLIHESSYAKMHSMLASARKHSTAEEAAIIAKKAHAKLLVLIHFSARYKTTTQLAKDAQKVFRRTIAARDGLRLSV